MKNFVEKIKDFLYDAIDYLLILVIVVGVAVVIGWRLDILFAKDMDKLPEDNDKTSVTDVVENDNDKNTDNDSFSEDNTNNSSDEDVDNNNGEEEEKNSVDNNVDNTDSGDDIDSNDDAPADTITFKIPSGSLPPTIGNILIENGLIESKIEFLTKSQELKLDTKLKSGEFSIKKGTELEELIRILAK